MLTLTDILRDQNQRRVHLERRLDSIVGQLRELGALKVVLYGSLARGEVGATSDLDLLVVMPSTKTGKEWMSTIYETVERGVACDIVAYNEREFEAECNSRCFLQHVLASGKVVYDKPG